MRLQEECGGDTALEVGSSRRHGPELSALSPFCRNAVRLIRFQALLETLVNNKKRHFTFATWLSSDWLSCPSCPKAQAQAQRQYLMRGLGCQGGLLLCHHWTTLPL